MNRQILIATTNPGKIAELAAMLDAPVQWRGLADFPSIREVVEDGETFAENARKKALGYAEQTGLWTIADDSGLVIDALDGAPGVRSARFAAENETDRSKIDRKNNARVLELLKETPDEKRTARFICCICLASPEKVLLETQVCFEGIFATAPAGQNGFGYDPLFYVPELKKTAAQLTAQQKNAISHRGNAIKALKPALDKLLETA